MRFLHVALFSLCASGAFADGVKPATLDLKCVETDSTEPRMFEVKSSKDGAVVTFGGVEYSSKQLMAGTEGGPAYLQAVNNEAGYNITIEGGDLQTAFDSNMTVTNGEADTHVFLFGETDDHFMAVCKGTFSFGS